MDLSVVGHPDLAPLVELILGEGPGRRLALVVATSRYEDPAFGPLAGDDARALAGVLGDPEICGFEVTTLVDEPHHRVARAVGELCRDRHPQDLVLLHITGRAVADDFGRLYLATTDTRRDDPLLTALPVGLVDRALQSCSSEWTVLVLDCDPADESSHLDPGGDRSHVDPADERSHLDPADERPRLDPADQSSRLGESFHGRVLNTTAGRLVAGLRGAAADLDGDGDITLDELFFYSAEMPPSTHDRIVIGRDPNWRLPFDVRVSLDSQRVSDRLAVLDKLERLHRTGNEFVRARVSEALHRLTEDDSKRVADAARARLDGMRG